MINRRHVLAGAALALPSCHKSPASTAATNPALEAFSPRFFDFIGKSASLEVLGSGYGWSEGPAWDKARGQLYFTDVPGNTAYVWKEGQGVEVFLSPSGAIVEGFREPGANGLFYSRNGQLILCNHGKRGIESLNIDSKARTLLTKSYKNKAYNSPNDVVEASTGDLYFTDPPYGLEGLDASPLKEQAHNGVYHLSKSGAVKLMIADLTFPNGVALSPDERWLYVAQSDPKAMHIYRLDLTDPKAEKELLVDLAPFSGPDLPGLPDGMVIDQKGYLFATGPGGVFVISPKGDVLGRIKTGKGSANCTFGEDGSTLFITNHDQLVKIPTLTRGLAWGS